MMCGCTPVPEVVEFTSVDKQLIELNMKGIEMCLVELESLKKYVVLKMKELEEDLECLKKKK